MGRYFVTQSVGMPERCHATKLVSFRLFLFFLVLRVTKLICCMCVAEANNYLIEIDNECLDYLLVVILQEF